MKNEKFVYFLILVLSFIFVFKTPVYAQSDYVLPYPSRMPGSFLYKPRLIIERLSEFWYFGSFGKFAYNLKQSDKYLVEAKTLLEYKQYLLAYNALKKSDDYFDKTLPNLENAKKEGKNITQNRQILSDAAKKHIEILTTLQNQVPGKFVWQPEKAAPVELSIKAAIQSSVKLRSKSL